MRRVVVRGHPSVARRGFELHPVRRQRSSQPKGIVIRQAPKAGRQLPVRSTVDLLVSLGKKKYAAGPSSDDSLPRLDSGLTPWRVSPIGAVLHLHPQPLAWPVPLSKPLGHDALKPDVADGVEQAIAVLERDCCVPMGTAQV
jgi:hypothetical protein